MAFHETISFDVTKKEVVNLKVGAKFEATVKGTIMELEAEREFESFEVPVAVGDKPKKGKKRIHPPRVRVELTSVKVIQPNAFSALVDSDDDEEDD